MVSRRAIAGAAAVVLAGLGLWGLRERYRGPVRAVAVAPGIVIAGQPEAGEWRELLLRFGIRSVINLRGPRASERWYAEEAAACRDLGIARDDVRVKLDDAVPQHELRRLVALLEQRPRPLLLHCKDGYDRSGWGAAVALALAGEPLDRALEPLSPASGHLCRRDRCPLHRFFAEYVAWLDGAGATHSAATFRSWALTFYCPPPWDAAIELLAEPPRRVAPGQVVALPVRVANRSPQPWVLSAAPDRGVRLGARCLGPLDAPPADPLAEFRRSNGPARDLARAGLEDGVIAAGSERLFDLHFPAPAAPGAYVVQVDMVDERVHWFSDLGGPGVTFPLEVIGD